MTPVATIPRDSFVRRAFVQHTVIWVFLLFLVLSGLVTGGRFLAHSNLSVILFQSSVVGVLVLGQTLVMLIAGIDLSIATIAILAAIIMGAAGSERQTMMNMSGMLPYLGFWHSIGAAMIVSALAGFANGIAVANFHIPPFIATLAMSLALSGLAMLMTGGAPVHYPDNFYADFGTSRFLSLTLPVWVFLALATAMGLFLNHSALGMKIYAIGGNARASALSGIAVRRVTIFAYVLSGVFGGVAGFLFLARTGSVAPTSGGSLLLSTIAAAVVGGVSLSGGKGSILNAAVATLLLASLSNLMNMLLVSPHLQNAVGGMIIIVAIMMNVHLDTD